MLSTLIQMNSSIIATLFFLIIFSTQCSSTSINLKLTKHPSTNHYLTRLHLADSSPHLLAFILDLDTPFVWTHHHNPGPLGRVTARSIDCLTANGHQNPPTAASTCSLTTANPITGESVSGELVTGELLFDEEAGDVFDRFLYVSGAFTEGRRLPDGIDGVLGFGRKSRVSLISQLSHSISMTRRFSVCFSGGNGDGFVSLGRDTGLDEIKGSSMAYTPMMVVEDRVTSSTGNNYYVNVKAMEINGRKLVVQPVKAKISSVVRYTTLSRVIYGTIMKGFEEAAAKSGMIRAPAVGGFELCYRKLEETKAVPVVEFVMQSELVRWRFDEKNVMVDVGKDTMCLGVVEGGEDDEVVVGGYTLEENLVEFDLESEMVGFSGSLLRRGNGCGKLSEKIARIAGARGIESI